MARIVTYEDVHAAIGRARTSQTRVAKTMGIARSSFQAQISDLNGRPSPAWVARFTDALDALTRGTPADR